MHGISLSLYFGSVIAATLKPRAPISFHGNLFEFHRGDGFGNTRNYFSTTVPHLVYNQFGGIIGGPIKKDRVFFFADYQGTHSRSQSYSARHCRLRLIRTEYNESPGHVGDVDRHVLFVT